MQVEPITLKISEIIGGGGIFLLMIYIIGISISGREDNMYPCLISMILLLAMGFVASFDSGVYVYRSGPTGKIRDGDNHAMEIIILYDPLRAFLIAAGSIVVYVIIVIRIILSIILIIGPGILAAALAATLTIIYFAFVIILLRFNRRNYTTIITYVDGTVEINKRNKKYRANKERIRIRYGKIPNLTYNQWKIDLLSEGWRVNIMNFTREKPYKKALEYLLKRFEKENKGSFEVS